MGHPCFELMPFGPRPRKSPFSYPSCRGLRIAPGIAIRCLLDASILRTSGCRKCLSGSLCRSKQGFIHQGTSHQPVAELAQETHRNIVFCSLARHFIALIPMAKRGGSEGYALYLVSRPGNCHRTICKQHLQSQERHRGETGGVEDKQAIRQAFAEREARTILAFVRSSYPVLLSHPVGTRYMWHPRCRDIVTLHPSVL